MVLNQYWKIAEKLFKETPLHFGSVKIDEYVIMPNHVHGIIVLHDENVVHDNVGNADLHSLQEDQTTKKSLPEWQQKTKMLLSKVVQGYKAWCTRKIRTEYNDYEFKWQKSFYDVIIRNDEQLSKTREYIRNNPLKWEEDVNNENKIWLIKK